MTGKGTKTELISHKYVQIRIANEMDRNNAKFSLGRVGQEKNSWHYRGWTLSKRTLSMVDCKTVHSICMYSFTPLFTQPTLTHHTGIASGIADVSNMQDQVSLVNLAGDEVGGIECRLLCCHDLQAVIHLSISHVWKVGKVMRMECINWGNLIQVMITWHFAPVAYKSVDTKSGHVNER